MAVAALPGVAGAGEPITVYSKSTRFRIPFQVDPVEIERIQATEVQLYLSDDGGGHWRRLDGVAPTTGRFHFDAPGDGSYLFSVKTLAGRGQLFPPGPHSPSLLVVVDTLPPRLELTLRETEPGQVLLSWRAEDSYLDLPSLEIRYQKPGRSEWQAAAVTPASSGLTTWSVEQAGLVHVKGYVRDRAGNEAEAQTSLVVAPSRVAPESPDYRRPVARSEKPAARVAANSPLSTEEAAPATDRISMGQAEPRTIDSAAAIPPETLPRARTWPISRESPQIAPRSRDIPTHSVNATTFRVGYEFEEVGPSGIGEVQLYITENDGGEWFHYGSDPDRTSPMVVTVPAEKTYGFSFRISNGVGYVADPPQPGEKPDVVVVVDQTPPFGTLRAAAHSARVAGHNITITWQADDGQQLGARPVSLFYASHPNGPWQLIASEQAASGEYQWMPPPGLDQRVFLRMRVSDAAGNVANIDGAAPVALDRSQPKARVIGIEPADAGGGR